MQKAYEAAILLQEKGNRIEMLIKALEEQTIRPARIIAVCPPGREKGLFSGSAGVSGLCVVNTEGSGEGLLLSAAFREAKTDFLMVLKEGACPGSAGFAETLLSDFEDPSVSAAYTTVFSNEKELCAPFVLDRTWLSYETIYSAKDIYKYGPVVFLHRAWSCMYRTADVREVFLEPEGITHPEFMLNARLLYDGKKIVREERVSSSYAPSFNAAVAFSEAFSVAAGVKLHYPYFGAGTVRLMPRLRSGYGECREKAKEYLKTHRAGIRKLRLSFLIASAELGDYFGEHYHRLPAKLNRLLSRNPYFL